MVLVFSVLFMTSPTAVHASCLALNLATIPRTGDLIVLSGTVVAAEPGRTDLAIEAWFAGAVPRPTVTVLGGLVQPGAITSADWKPTVGERYLVVATARPDGSIVTAPCQQMPTDPAVLATARRVFGEPIQPSVGPQRAGKTATNDLPIAILIATAIVAATGLSLVLWAKRAGTT